MKRITIPTIILAMLTLAGCVATPGSEEQMQLMSTPPTQWQSDDLAMARANGRINLCAFYRQGVVPYGRVPYTQADFAAIETTMRDEGLTTRDIELIRRRSSTYGTNQTYAGLACSLGYEPRINRSFYPGTGHQWQAIISSSTFIYLRGDGTPRGMRVYAWN